MTLQMTDWEKETLSGKKLSEKESKNFVVWIYNELKRNGDAVGITICDNFPDFLQNVGLNMPSDCINGEIRDHIQIQGIRQVRDKVEHDDWTELKSKIDADFSKILGISSNIDFSTRRLNHKLNPTEQFCKDFTGQVRKIGLGYDSWIRFYDYYSEQGIVRDEKFDRFKDFMLKGVWEAVFFEHEAVICRLPKQVSLSSQGLLNSEGKQPAIVWHDGTENFYKHGICVDDLDLNKESLTEILQMRNIEQRYALLKDFDFEELEKTAKNLRMIDKSKKGNTLYEVELEDGHTAKFVKYKDPSTDRIYWSFVAPEIQTADEGMAWKFQLDKKEYENMDGEA